MQAELKIVKDKRRHKFNVKLRIDEDRIWFQHIPFSKLLNAEIKSFKGYRWHGFADPPIKKWSIENCPRNVIQLKALMGEDVKEWFKQPLMELTKEDFDRPAFEELGREIKPAQIDMVNRALTYHYQILAAEQGLGKSLSSIEIMERSGKNDWWYVGPKSAMKSFELEIQAWGLSDEIRLTTLTFESLVKKMRYDFDGLVPPQGIIFDESDNLKNPTAHRSIAAQSISDLVREKWGMDGYVIELSGTPSAKNPSDVWNQAEIAWPGYLREGSLKAFENRYAVMEEGVDMDGVKFTRRSGWLEEEIAKLPMRYAGLMPVYRKHTWLPDLPAKKYRSVKMIPSNKVLRVAKSLVNIAPNTITALTWLRALSSGFQYVNTKIGDKECHGCEGTGEVEETCHVCGGVGTISEYEKQTRQVKTPKDNALRDELDICDTQGRIVIAASFQGSIDRIRKICKERGWAVACVDGRGWRSYDAMGKSIDDNPLDLWEKHRGKVAFVGNPGSCRYGLTLTLSHTLVFYDNSFSAVQRLQMEDRIHRMSMDTIAGATIVDLIHLQVDQLVVDTLKMNKKLEHMSLGVIGESIGIDSGDDELLLEEV